MQARIKLVCPDCDEEMTCVVIDRQEHPRNWVLSPKSRQHLAEKPCQIKVETPHLTVVAA